MCRTCGISSSPGPSMPRGVSDTPSRRTIFTCRPLAPEEARPCAEEILSRLGRLAYRRNLTERNLNALMSLYDSGAAADGFEEGIRMGIEGMLASPNFVFRIEEPLDPREAEFGYRLTDTDLASRLSFFLWGTIPDGELLDAGGGGPADGSCGIRGAGAPDARGPPFRGAREAVRAPVVPAAGPGQDQSERPALSGLLPAVEVGDGGGDGALLPTTWCPRTRASSTCSPRTTRS